MAKPKFKVVTQERKYDFLFDPCYHFSSFQDQLNKLFAAYSDNEKKMPNYKNLFCDSEFRPSFSHVPQYNNHLVSKFISSQCVVPNKTINSTIENLDYRSARPRERFGGFSGNGITNQIQEDEENLPLSKDVIIQTDFRESEAQTHPYSPPFKVVGENSPDVLLLSNLKYNRMPTKYDILIIALVLESNRKEEELELKRATMCPEAYRKAHAKLILDFEQETMRIREEEISDLHETKLQIKNELIRRQQEKSAEKISQAVERKTLEEVSNYERKHSSLKTNLLRDLNKIENNYQNQLLLTKSSKASPFEYRQSLHLERDWLNRIKDNPQATPFSYKNYYLGTLDGLDTINNMINKDLDKIYSMEIKPYRISKRVLKETKKIKQLHEYFHNRLVVNESENLVKKTVSLESATENIREMSSSITPPEGSNQSAFNQALIMLQTLIRGRAVQFEMSYKRLKNEDLIQELRSTHALLDDERAEKEQQREAIIMKQRKQLEEFIQKDDLEESLKREKSSILTKLLEKLNKDLTKKIEEHKIMTLTWKALERRRLLEAQEAGRRQIEERKHLQVQEVFNHSQEMNQITIKHYLRSITRNIIERTSSSISKDVIESYSQQVDLEAYALDNTKPVGFSTHELSSALVHQFLIPHVDRTQLNQIEELERRKNMLAIRAQLFPEEQQENEEEI